jgi:hypothetical protein
VPVPSAPDYNALFRSANGSRRAYKGHVTTAFNKFAEKIDVIRAEGNPVSGPQSQSYGKLRDRITDRMASYEDAIHKAIALAPNTSGIFADDASMQAKAAAWLTDYSDRESQLDDLKLKVEGLKVPVRNIIGRDVRFDDDDNSSEFSEMSLTQEALDRAKTAEQDRDIALSQVLDLQRRMDSLLHALSGGGGGGLPAVESPPAWLPVMLQAMMQIPREGPAQAKLPHLTLAMFTGQEPWPPWFDSYYALVHCRNLQPIEKYQHLLTAIPEGSSAREAIGGFPFTKEAYPNVIQRLKERFGKPRVLVSRLLREIIHYTPDPDAPDTRKTVDYLHAKLRQMENYKIDFSQPAANLLLLSLYESKIPQELLVKWERFVAVAELGTENVEPIPDAEACPPLKLAKKVEDFLRFLETHVSATESAQECLAPALPPPVPPPVVHRKPLPQPPKASHTLAASDGLPLQAAPPRKKLVIYKTGCIFCGANHAHADCPIAPRSPMNHKWRQIRSKPLCYRCICAKHALGVSCPLGPCGIDGCPAFHHPFFHKKQ